MSHVGQLFSARLRPSTIPMPVHTLARSLSLSPSLSLQMYILYTHIDIYTLYLHMCTSMYMYTYVYIHTYIHTCMHACMHTYTHIYIYIHTTIYIYISMCTHPSIHLSIHPSMDLAICLSLLPSRPPHAFPSRRLRIPRVRSAAAARRVCCLDDFVASWHGPLGGGRSSHGKGGGIGDRLRGPKRKRYTSKAPTKPWVGTKPIVFGSPGPRFLESP